LSRLARSSRRYRDHDARTLSITACRQGRAFGSTAILAKDRSSE
jgi:hypothetical protein